MFFLKLFLSLNLISNFQVTKGQETNVPEIVSVSTVFPTDGFQKELEKSKFI